MMEKFSVIIFLAVCISSVYAHTARSVTIKNGTLIGTVMQSRKGRHYYAFRGIPYAHPPLGKLRFQPPAPPTAWDRVLNATAYRSDCLQQDPTLTTVSHSSEDCLYINVFTPKSDNERDKLYAVMVYFYGGLWTAGGASPFSASYLMDHNIVLVTMNFRLGPLGFLSTADDVIPGNQAMKDQVQALRWIQENIEAFGGDRKRITIVGHSSGAVGVNHIMLSPLARGYFHRVITQSETSLGPHTFNTPDMARASAERLGRELHCPTATSSELLKCLQKKNAEDILAQPYKWTSVDHIPGNEFLPVVELDKPGAFLTEEPSVLLRTGRYPDVPWLNGLVSDEGGIPTVGYYVQPNQTSLKNLNLHFPKLAPVSLGYQAGCSNASQNLISHQIRQHYFGNKALDESTRMNLVSMYSDGWFKYASATAMQLHLRAQTSPAHFYQIRYKGAFSATRFFGDRSRDYGVVHSDELRYLFPIQGITGSNNSMSARDLQMVDTMTTLWTNFVKTGKPIPKATKKFPVIWEPVTTNALETFVIKDPGNFFMSKNIYRKILDFWSKLPCRAGLARSTILNDESKILNQFS